MAKNARKRLSYFIELQDVSILLLCDADKRDAHLCRSRSFLGVFNARGVTAVELPAVIFDSELCFGPVEIEDEAPPSSNLGCGSCELHVLVERGVGEVLSAEQIRQGELHGDCCLHV